eukprot:1190264-Rhodomonas_salina.1
MSAFHAEIVSIGEEAREVRTLRLRVQCVARREEMSEWAADHSNSDAAVVEEAEVMPLPVTRGVRDPILTSNGSSSRPQCEQKTSTSAKGKFSSPTGRLEESLLEEQWVDFFIPGIKHIGGFTITSARHAPKQLGTLLPTPAQCEA